jgi:hypothetical protein
MEYLYTNRKVVKLTNNIIKTIEEIAQRDGTLLENAYIGIDFAGYSVKYVDGIDVDTDDFNDDEEIIDLYPIHSFDWIRYNSKLKKYIIMRQNINKFAQEYHQFYLDIFRESRRIMKKLGIKE